MSKIIILLLCLLSIAATAQQKKKTMDISKIYHKWHPTHMEAQGQRQPLEQGEDGSYLWFKPNKTVEEYDPATGTKTKQWAYDSQTQTLTITSPDETTKQTIISLTDKELILQTSSADMGEMSLIFRKMEKR